MPVVLKSPEFLTIYLGSRSNDAQPESSEFVCQTKPPLQPPNCPLHNYHEISYESRRCSKDRSWRTLKRQPSGMKGGLPESRDLPRLRDRPDGALNDRENAKPPGALRLLIIPV